MIDWSRRGHSPTPSSSGAEIKFWTGLLQLPTWVYARVLVPAAVMPVNLVEREPDADIEAEVDPLLSLLMRVMLMRGHVGAMLPTDHICQVMLRGPVQSTENTRDAFSGWPDLPPGSQGRRPGLCHIAYPRCGPGGGGRFAWAPSSPPSSTPTPAVLDAIASGVVIVRVAHILRPPHTLPLHSSCPTILWLISSRGRRRRSVRVLRETHKRATDDR